MPENDLRGGSQSLRLRSARKSQTHTMKTQPLVCALIGAAAGLIYPLFGFWVWACVMGVMVLFAAYLIRWALSDSP